jgi:dTDP-6-deoxy-L-talose 4-dehydrogenase (NAD+)
MRVLVTGANGFIGRHVIKILQQRSGVDIVAADLVLEKNTCCYNLECDLFSVDSLYELAGMPDYCIHLAWMNGFVHDASSHMEQLSQHYKLCTALLDSGIRGLSVMGTMHEVGYYEGEVNESTQCNPVTLYGIAKNALCRSLLVNKNANRVKWLRTYYICGDDLRNKSIFTKLLQAELNGLELFSLTAGMNKFDFIDINELANQIVTASLQDEVCGIIECCSGQPKTLYEMISEFAKKHQLKLKLEFGKYPERISESPIMYGRRKKIDSIILKG